MQHFGAAQAAKVIAWVVVGLSLIAGTYLGSWLGSIVGALGTGGGLFIYLKLLARAKSMLKPSCVCLGKAVAFVGWDGTRQIFEIVSRKYAGEFMNANKRKLINLSQDARELLEGEGYEHHASSVQSARRYRK
jgi:hypothetical protein